MAVNVFYPHSGIEFSVEVEPKLKAEKGKIVRNNDKQDNDEAKVNIDNELAESERSFTGNNSDVKLGLTLRKLAEEIARTREVLLAGDLDAHEANGLVHELQVHQIELEMQNEELRWTQESLHKTRARYLDLYDMAPVAYISINDKGLIETANLTAARLMSVPRGALLKQPLTRFILPEDQDNYYMYRKKLLESGKHQVSEFRMKPQVGPVFWARCEAAVSQDSETGFPLIRAVISEINESKQIEIELNGLLESREQIIKRNTIELEELKQRLEEEITSRKRAEQALKEAADELDRVRAQER